MSPSHRKVVAAGDTDYGSPFRHGPYGYVTVTVDVSALTTREVDAQGHIKPGVPLAATGLLVGVGVKVYGVTMEPVKIPTADNNATATLAAATDFRLSLGAGGVVNRAVIESLLGAVLTADEVAGFAQSGIKLEE